MAKPVYYIHKSDYKDHKEIEKMIKIFHDAGFKVVIISDGEDLDISSCFRKMICDK